jgi:hypothetical protein
MNIMHKGKPMFVETINPYKILEWVNKIWAKSMAAFLMFFLGLWMGSINAEGRIVSDCKFSNTFRVEIQSFSCQRRI